MKKIFLLFAIFSCTMAAHAVPSTYDLQGGNWGGLDTIKTNEDLWKAFKPAYNKFYGLNRSDFPITNVSSFANSYMQEFMTSTGSKNGQSSWKWLGDYILNGVTYAPGSEAAWRWQVHSFFNCLPANTTEAKPSYQKTDNFTEKGKPSAWLPSYEAWFAKSNDPIKLGYDFMGWWTAATGGTEVTNIDNATGTVYAHWEARLQWKNEIDEDWYAHVGGASFMGQDKDGHLRTAIPTIMAGDVVAEDSVWVAFVVGAEYPVEWKVVDVKTGEEPDFVEITTVQDNGGKLDSEYETEGGNGKWYKIDYDKITTAAFHDVVKNNYIVQIKRGRDASGKLLREGGKVKIIATCAEQNQQVEAEMWVPERPLEVEEGTIKYVYAYDLRAKFWPNDEGNADAGINDYEFYFKPNAEFTTGKLIIHTENGDILVPFKADKTYFKGVGEEVSVLVPELTLIELLNDKGVLNTTVYSEMLKETYEAKNLQWSIELTGPEVPTFGYTRKGEIPSGDCRTGVLAVNTAPQSSTFGRAYAYIAYKNDPEHDKGSYIFDAAMNVWENSRQGNIPWNTMARMAIDDDNGGVYFTDKSHTNPGIFYGQVNEFHPENMPITPFFPENLVTVDKSDEDDKDANEARATAPEPDRLPEEGHFHYPIIKSGETEIGSAFLAVDTYVRKMADGTEHLFLYGYAKGHSKVWGDTQGPSKEEVNGRDNYGYSAQKKDAEGDKHIPYHSIVEYDLGEVGKSATAWNASMPKKITAIGSNNHAAHTANIHATEDGLWICHARAEYNSTTWATALMFISRNSDGSFNLGNGSAGHGVYNVATSDEAKYVIGSMGAGFAYYERESGNDLLVLQNATGQLLVFEVTMSAQKVPDLTLVDVYEHKQTHFNQMNFDFAGNLFCAGPNGLSVFSFPEFVSKKEGEGITNTAVTPCPERFAIKQDLYYDLVFTNGKTNNGDHSWHDPMNWSREKVPGRNQIARIDYDVIVSGDSAEVAALDLNKNKNSNAYPTITIEPTGGLYYTAEVPNSQSKYARTVTNAHIQLVENQQPVPYVPLTSPDQVIIKSENHATETIGTVDGIEIVKTKETRGVLQNMVTMPATVDLGTYGRIDHAPALGSEAFAKWDPWQHIAVPFAVTAGDLFHKTIMYQWKENEANWSEFASYYVPMYRFDGYLLSHDDAWSEAIGMGINHTDRHVLKGELDPAINNLGSHLSVNETDATVINLAYTSGVSDTDDYWDKTYTGGWNYLGNSWTAPIYIANFQEEDFVNMGNASSEGGTQAVVYLYDEGLQYKAYPIHLVKSDDPEFAGKTIPALTSFYVYANGEGASLRLDCKTLTSKTEWLAAENAKRTVNGMQARRVRPVSLNHEKMHITVTGAKGDMDELYLFEGAQYSDAHDQGYEALKLSGDGAYLAASTELGEMAIVASPQIEGTYLNFAKNVSTNYTFSFKYDGTDDLSLEDALMGTLTPIKTGATYNFVASEDDSKRFRIVRKRESTDVVTSVSNIWANENSLYMNNPMGELIEVSVYATDGQLVMHKQTRQSVTSLEVPMHGVYTIQVKSDNNVQTIKHIL